MTAKRDANGLLVDLGPNDGFTWECAHCFAVRSSFSRDDRIVVQTAREHLGETGHPVIVYRLVEHMKIARVR